MPPGNTLYCKLFPSSKFYNRTLYFSETMKYNEVNDKLEVAEVNMKEYTYVTLRQKPELKKKQPHGFMINGKCHEKPILNVWKPILIMKQNMVGIFA